MKENWDDNLEVLLAKMPAGQWHFVKFSFESYMGRGFGIDIDQEPAEAGRHLVEATAKLIEVIAVESGCEVRRSDTALFVIKPVPGGRPPYLPDVEVEDVPILDLDKDPREQKWLI